MWTSLFFIILLAGAYVSLPHEKHEKDNPSVSPEKEKEPENSSQQCVGVSSSELARELSLARTAHLATEQRLEHLQLEHKFALNAIKHEKSAVEAALKRAQLSPRLSEAVHTRQLLHAMFANTTIKLVEENVMLRLNNSELTYENSDLHLQIIEITQENKLMEQNLLELNRENLRLQNINQELFVQNKCVKKEDTHKLQHMDINYLHQQQEILNIRSKLEDILFLLNSSTLKQPQELEFNPECKAIIEQQQLVHMDGIYYHFNFTKLSWREARNECLRKGLELAKLENITSKVLWYYRRKTKEEGVWIHNRQLLTLQLLFESTAIESPLAEHKCTKQHLRVGRRARVMKGMKIDCEERHFYVCELACQDRDDAWITEPDYE